MLMNTMEMIKLKVADTHTHIYSTHLKCNKIICVKHATVSS